MCERQAEYAELLGTVAWWNRSSMLLSGQSRSDAVHFAYICIYIYVLKEPQEGREVMLQVYDKMGRITVLMCIYIYIYK